MASDVERKVKQPHVLIRQKAESRAAGELMEGRNTEVLINGQPFADYVTEVEIRVGTSGFAEVRLEMLASVEFDGNVVPEVTVKGKKEANDASDN